MDPLYREIILEHWQNPQNAGVINDADFDITEHNPLCGDKIRLTGKIKNGKLEEIAFEGVGCAISQASASLFTEEIKGESLESAKKIKEQDVLDLLEIELTPARMKCALLIYKTLQKGITKQQ
ncbi:MAG TPA: SUF system NifU family Fe-S cluster assembly protein [Candidatus Saccharimonadales bacterium]|nr:SUF system NifU family Fe-S cluster assembly protein [Candidatus Saccharimonadales bacterium]